VANHRDAGWKGSDPELAGLQLDDGLRQAAGRPTTGE